MITSAPKTQAPKLPAMHLPRTIRTHECTEADKLLAIRAGPDGKGGAPLHYNIMLSNYWNAHDGRATWVQIPFQNGPICENGLNGITIESLLAICADRLDRFQNGPYECRENAKAGVHIMNALQCLHDRTRRRQREHAEGTSAPDSSHVAPVSDRCAPPPSPPNDGQSGEGRVEGSKQEPEAQAPGASSPDRHIGIDFAKGDSEPFAAMLTLDDDGKVIAAEKLDIETGRRMIKDILKRVPGSEQSEGPASSPTADRGLRSAQTTPPAYTGDARAVAEQS